MFGQQVQCSRKWIGTTEAAALLRYFGCRALLVEFLGEQSLECAIVCLCGLRVSVWVEGRHAFVEDVCACLCASAPKLKLEFAFHSITGQ